jgi:squalene-associated FAD-dependent desaturase
LSTGRRVVVIGGGLAGITAALDCADAGADVTLLEVRRRLGGAIYSFERDGLQIDNGQHVFMRCCTAYRALLARLGSERSVSVQPRLRVPVLSPGRRTALLARTALPAPLHMASALARYPYLTVSQRLGAARAALALRRMDTADETLDGHSFGDWLARRGQGPDAVGALWDVIVRPTLNLPAAQASLALGAFVFRTALLSDADAGDMGFHMAPLSATIGEPAERALRRAGVDVRLGWRAERLERTAAGLEVHGRGGRGQEDEEDRGEREQVAGESRAGEGWSAEAAIVALPHNRAGGLIEPLLGATAHRLAALGSSPIVNLHVVYDRQVCEQPFAAGVRTPVQYLFDRTAAGGVPSECQYLAVSLSAAEREMAMSVDALRELYLPALEGLLPRARGAKVERFLVTREHAATFRAAPGVAALRAGARTTVPGLLLAGTWTDTGWPATLEGAVLSGHSAAAQALRRLELDGPDRGASSAGGAEAARAEAL